MLYTGYFLLSIIPLWLITLLFRTVPHIHIAWIVNPWNTIISILVLIQGVCALWYHAEKTHIDVVRHVSHTAYAIQTGVIGNVFFLLSTNGMIWASGWLTFGCTVYAEKGTEQWQEKHPDAMIGAGHDKNR